MDIGLKPRRHLILLLDGSGKTAAARRELENHSNIYRLNLALRNHTRGGEAQITFYIAGVGASITRRRLLAEGMGSGLIGDVEQAYMNLCSNYNHGDEATRDAIYIFGFSRGAVVARLVAALISKYGLLDESDAHHFKQVWEHFVNRDERDFAACLPKDVAERMYKHIQIDFLGVFDTVLGFYFGSYDTGIIEYVIGKQLLPRNVRHAIQLLALDEHRRRFRPILWHAHEEPSNSLAIRQIWMPGVHTDIGGGYFQQDLADVSLLTMLKEIRSRTSLNLNNEFCLRLQDGVRRIYADQQRKIAINNERDSLAFKFTALEGKAGYRHRHLPASTSAPQNDRHGLSPSIHDFALWLHGREVVWKDEDEFKMYRLPDTSLKPTYGQSDWWNVVAAAYSG